MRKTNFLIIGLSVTILIFLTVYGMKHTYNNLSDLIEIDIEQITEISISDKHGHHRVTSDQKKIDELLAYLDTFHFKRIRGDQTTYMPMKAPIIYLYTDDTGEFIVPYADEAMVSYKVYKLKPSGMSHVYLQDIYNSIEDK